MIKLTTAAAASRPNGVYPVFARGDPFKGLPGKVAKAARALAKVRGFKAAAGETLLVATPAGQWVFLGLGQPVKGRPSPSAPADLALGLAKAFSELTKAGVRDASVVLPEQGTRLEPERLVRTASEALQMADYAFRAYRTRGPAPERVSIELVIEDGYAARRGLRDGQIVGDAVALTRDLINEPASVANPVYLAERAEEVARSVKARFTAIRGESLLRQGYDAIYAVGQASQWPPALVALEHGRASRDRPTVALVGKGVSFDSGGLDLKTSSGMALMKKDMGGAAIVLGAFQAIAQLGLPVHLVAVLGLAENAVGSRSYRPGDILRTKAGLTVEISNTDAEGRVVLADAFALARTYRPRYLVDFATLTGACRVALGKDLMGLFCDDATLREAIVASGTATGDAVWPLPLWGGYKKKLESPVADLINAPSDGFAGAITAALFLKEFVGDIAWAHLDCYAWSDGEHALFPKGGSGVGVRLLVDLIPRLMGAQGDGH
ncbi:MAG: leucyl aminopeptidase family protein [SAR324 cluster bacterium]